MSPIIIPPPPPRIPPGGLPIPRPASIRTLTPSPTAFGSKIGSTLTKKNYASQGRRGLDIRASRHSGPVRREPDGPPAAEFDAGKAGSGGDGGVNHLGLHRNASGRVEFPPSAVSRFCRRNIPEGSDD